MIIKRQISAGQTDKLLPITLRKFKSVLATTKNNKVVSLKLNGSTNQRYLTANLPVELSMKELEEKIKARKSDIGIEDLKTEIEVAKKLIDLGAKVVGFDLPLYYQYSPSHSAHLVGQLDILCLNDLNKYNCIEITNISNLNRLAYQKKKQLEKFERVFPGRLLIYAPRIDSEEIISKNFKWSNIITNNIYELLEKLKAYPSNSLNRGLVLANAVEITPQLSQSGT